MMDAASAVVGVPFEPPLIPEMDVGGLALLTEALLEGGVDGVDLDLQPIIEEQSTRLDNVELENGNEDEDDGVEVLNVVDTNLALVDASHASLLEDAQRPRTLLNADPIDNDINDTSTQAIVPIPRLNASSDIAAYFALEFLDMQYIYYLQRSSVSLGRSSALTTQSTNPSISGNGADIDLGPLKNISRLHARIEFDEELEGWVLAVIGRNGAFVDGTWREPGMRVPLGDRTLIQISTRAFYFILPNSSPTLPPQSPHELPALDSTVTTADDDSHSTSASATPKQRIKIPRRTHDEDLADEELEEDIDLEQDDDDMYPIPSGKGKGKEALAPPPKRGRGRPRKNPLLPPKPKPNKLQSPTKSIPVVYRDEDDDDLPMDEFSPEERDSGDDFVPKNIKRGRRGGTGGGKTRSGTMSRPGNMVPPPPFAGTASRPRPSEGLSLARRSESLVDVKDEEMDPVFHDEFEDLDAGDDGDGEDGMDQSADPASPNTHRGTKRKREDEGEGPSDKRRKSVGNKSKPKLKGGKREFKDGGAVLKGRKKKPEMKSLFTTIPAPSLSSVIASKEIDPNAGEDKKKKKGKEKGKGKGKEEVKKEGEEGEGDEEEDGDGVKKEEEKKDLGPPPPKPPFTYPLLCYKALKALNGKAPYRAITKWLESEYPYFAFATKEGKDGWENSTRHTLSSHRAFLKIDRKPEERGKGCFWSFDPEFEEQFKDQWRAAESQSRNPRPRPPNPQPGPPNALYPNANGPPNPNGANHPPNPMMYRPPFGPPGHWSGVTPPHLMPGYRPGAPPLAPPGHAAAHPPQGHAAGHPPYPPGQPFPYPPMGRGMPMPFGGPGFGPPPPGHPMHVPPPGGNVPKVRAPKKPKQALGAAFSRAPLIRPGLGGVPAKLDGTSTSTSGAGGGPKMDELIMRGQHIARMAAQAAKDELGKRAHPGAAMAVIMGGWGPPPLGGVNGAVKGGISARPFAGTKVEVVFAVPPDEALPVMPPPLTKAELKSTEEKDSTKDVADSPTATTSPTPTPAKPITIQMPLMFYDNKLYINPRAYPLIKEGELAEVQERNLVDVFAFLAGRSGVVPRGIVHHSGGGKEGIIGGKEEEEGNDEKASASPEVEAEVEAEEKDE